MTSGCVTAKDPGSGALTWKWPWNKSVNVPDAPADSLVLRGDHLEPEKTAAVIKGTAELAGAKELYRRGDYVNAQTLFAKIANNTKNSSQIAEEARYYEADCLRLQARYPSAADTYKKCLDDFPSGLKHDEANKRLFDICNYWLDDTRRAMDLAQEKKDGKRWFVAPASFVHFEKTKPLLDEEGRALELLEYVQINDPVGPLGEKALFFLGSVKFFEEDYKEADHYFSQIVNTRPNSPMASKALKLAIIAKQMSTGGPEYDGRKCAEARQLIDTALRGYPELAEKNKDFLERQIWSINQQDADRDYLVAEFYRRTGHPGAAYFYYELVRRRYPNTKYAKDADVRMAELRGKMDGTQKSKLAEAFTPLIPKWTHPESAETAPAPRLASPTVAVPAPARPVELGTPEMAEPAPSPRPVSNAPTGTR
jgi:outer membrane protein assembly factor BamD (BamD/ComL family)